MVVRKGFLPRDIDDPIVPIGQAIKNLRKQKPPVKPVVPPTKKRSRGRRFSEFLRRRRRSILKRFRF